MDESFTLLSSMSPKIKTKTKYRSNQHTRKGPNKLALRKYFRKSIGFDALKSTKNTSVCLDHEDSISCSSGSFENEIIPDSAEENEDKVDIQEVQDSFVKSDKFIEIKNWIANIPSFKSDEISEDTKENVDDDVIVIEDSFEEIEPVVKIGDTPAVLPRKKPTANSVCTDDECISSSDVADVDDESEHNTSLENILNKVNKRKLIKTSNLLLSEPRHLPKLDIAKKGAQTERKKNVKQNLHREIVNRAKMIQNLESPAHDPIKNLTTNMKKKLNFEDSQDDLLNVSDSKSILDKLYGNSWRLNENEILTPCKNDNKSTLSINKKADSLLSTTKKKAGQKLIFESDKKCNVENEKRSDFNKGKSKEDQIKPKENKTVKLSPKQIQLNDITNNYTNNKLRGSCDAEYSDSNENEESKIIVKPKIRRRVFSTSSEESLKSVASIDPEAELKKVNDMLYNRFLNTEDKNKGKKKVEMEKPVKKKETEKSKNNKREEKPMPVVESVHENNISFLASLSANIKITDIKLKYRPYRTNFAENKIKLSRKLFDYFNLHVFESKLPADCTLDWNDKMRRTAGFCKCKKITRRNGAVERKCVIELATKIITTADRLRDTLVHEMCHAATFIVNEVVDGHGSYWQAWTKKAMAKFPELPAITRCHDYNISTKYSYVCTNCSYTIGRHSKSLDLERKRCGYCYGKFEVFINKKKGGKEVKVPAKTTKQVSGFALYVKENYGTVRNPQMSHAEVMRVLGQQFSSLKVKDGC